MGMGTNAVAANQIADALEGHYVWKDLMDCLDFLHVEGPSSRLLKIFSILVVLTSAKKNPR